MVQVTARNVAIFANPDIVGAGGSEAVMIKFRVCAHDVNGTDFRTPLTGPGQSRREQRGTRGAF